MIKDILFGCSSFLKAIPYLFIKGQFKYIFVIGAISLLIGLATFGLIWNYSEFLSDWLNSFYKWERGSTIISYITGALSKLVLFLVAFSTYKYLILIITAPILSLISERLETKLTNQTPRQTTIKQNIKSIWRGIRISIRNLSREILFTILLLALSLIPGLAIITTPLIFIVQAYYAGFANFDLFNERRMNLKETVSYANYNRISYLVNGSGFMLMVMVPILGFMVAPALCVTAATLESVRKN